MQGVSRKAFSLLCRKKDGKEDEGKVRKVREPKKKVQEAGEEDGEWETIQGSRQKAKVLNKQEIKHGNHTGSPCRAAMTAWCCCMAASREEISDL